MPAPSRPTVSLARAADLVGEHWGVYGSLRELDSYADRNFQVTDEDGRSYTFKLSRETPDIVDLQLAALQHLAGRASGELVPRVIETLDGRKMVPALDDERRPFTMHMLSWLDGQLWSELEQANASQRVSLGRALAQLDLDLREFRHASMHRQLRWRLPAAEWIAEHLGVIESDFRRAVVIDAIAQLRARVIPRLGELPHQVIHGDANPANLLVSGDQLSGLFDFGDINLAPAICELAVALAYAGMVDDSVEACAEVCAGYHERRPLSTIELDLLYDLVRARLAVSVVSSSLAHAAEPDNDYILVSQRPAWDLLGKLTEFGRGAVTKYIAGACKMAAPPPVPGAVSRTRLMGKRRTRLSRALSLSYAQPLYLRRGERCWLFDESDQAWLDCVNNVAHVGHSHPRVLAAASMQQAVLNTNTRYLHENLLLYAERLCATLPRSLNVVFLVNSGSEANELALRIARAHTGGDDVIVVDGAYHGHTSTLIDLSPYKFNGPGGRGQPSWVHVLETPDPFRGRHGNDGRAYAAGIDDITDALDAQGKKLAAFMCEPIMSCAGQIVPAKGFLNDAFWRVRAAGGVCIVDEVQTGFGRVGDGMWAFEAENVVPDILTLGKPIANGHPVGAVVVREEIAASFANGMEYFNTFGGNPVSCAIASAVLEVIDDEGMRDNAREVGRWLLTALREIEDPGIGEVRGRGLFIGVELVEDGESKTPAGTRAKAVVEYAREHGVLLSTDGPGHNVIKIKPPLCFGRVEGRILVEVLAAGLRAAR